MTVNAFTDGAARGNPGESGIGIVLKDEKGTILATLSGYIGVATNNVAEYNALLVCLKRVATMSCSRLVVHSDSELMVRQLHGKYKVKDPGLKILFRKVHEILKKAPFEFEIRHIRREQNSEADELANIGIDSRKRLRI